MNTNQMKSMVVVLVAVLAGCGAAPADADYEGQNEPSSELDLAKSNTARSNTSTTTISPAGKNGKVASPGDAGIGDTGSAADDTGTGSAESACPVEAPIAGTACDSDGSFCGYGSPCGLAMAQCSGGVWVVSASSSC